MIYKRFCYRYEFSKFHEMDSKPGKRVLNISLNTTITCFRDYHNVTFTFPGDDHNVFLYIIDDVIFYNYGTDVISVRLRAKARQELYNMR